MVTCEATYAYTYQLLITSFMDSLDEYFTGLPLHMH